MNSYVKIFSIFGLGTIVVDHQVVLEKLPKDDHKGEVLDDRYQVGGPVPTALCLLRKFGMESTFQGKWADDQYGRMIEEDLRGQGVAFEAPLCHNDSRTGFAHVWLEQKTGKRTIAGYRGSHEIGADEIDEKIVAGHDCLHSDGWSGEAAIRAMRIMRETGGRVFMDLGSPKTDVEKLLREVDSLNCPESLIPRLFETDDLEAGAERLLEMGPQEVTITRGSEGVCYFSKSERVEQAAYGVEAVDTNGAGDVFAGAMIFATMQDWPLVKRLQFACAAAALKCAKRGNREALPDLGEVGERTD
ncbi:MAG: carbohydrate kinase family protein [Verrucomicrobia bacterium]|nr:carbohydrate kinase family protein [Verrucomicrobiota bacterium]